MPLLCEVEVLADLRRLAGVNWSVNLQHVTAATDGHDGIRPGLELGPDCLKLRTRDTHCARLRQATDNRRFADPKFLTQSVDEIPFGCPESHHGRAPGGAVAGMLSRAVDGATGWQALANDDHVLRPGLRPATPVSDVQRQRLATLGINTLQVVRAPGREPIPAQTLAGPATAVPDWRFLAQRRLANFIVSSIEHGTRWLLFAPNEASTWRRAVEQLQVFFGSLEAQGAFDARAEGERWFVTCDERLNRELERSTGVVNLVFGFAAARPGDFHAFLLSHRPAGSRLHPVSMSRLQASGYRPELLFDELPTAP